MTASSKAWLKVINKTELEKTLSKIKPIYLTKSIMPEYKNILRAFALCDYNNLKVVMVGQEPYPQKGVATGIAFGCEKEVQPSLEVLKNTAINLYIPHNLITFDNTLESWCRQGVLMLNSSLTVEVGKPLSHMHIWTKFTTELIKNINLNKQNLVYVFMGNFASEYAKLVDKDANLIIKVKHPAYYARTNEDMPDFFTEINKYLDFCGINKIKWYQEDTIY